MATKTIKGDVDCSGMKRCYVQAPPVSIKCPNCGKKITHHFDYQYFSNPEIKYTETLYFNCDDGGCGEFIVPVKIKSIIMTMEFDPAKVMEA